MLRELSMQIGDNNEVEIVVADDCSTDAAMARLVMDEAHRLGCRLLKRERNSGRAAIRNALADNAEGQYLLFIDADAMPAEPTFVADYIEKIGQADVVCGTVMSPEECPSAEVSLRWVYDHTSMPRFVAKERRKKPYDSFSSFCFMIRRDVFLQIRFDEDFNGYGYEDTLFGSALKVAGAIIAHYDIGCFHLGLEPNAVFMRKVEASNQTLLSHAEKIGEASSLLRMTKIMQRLGLLRFGNWLFNRCGADTRQNLIGGNPPSYELLQGYKLIHLCHLMVTKER